MLSSHWSECGWGGVNSLTPSAPPVIFLSPHLSPHNEPFFFFPGELEDLSASQAWYLHASLHPLLLFNEMKMDLTFNATFSCPPCFAQAPWINTGINGWPESGGIKAAMKFVYLAAELYSAGDIWHNNARTVGSVIKSVFRCFRSDSLRTPLTVCSDQKAVLFITRPKLIY